MLFRSELPVILVVGMRLGCINHALLTRDAIAASGCRLLAWVANSVDDGAPQGYFEALTERLDAPCLGNIPAVASADMAAASLALRVIDD